MRARYAAAAIAATGPEPSGCCDANGAVITDEQAELFGQSLYADGERDELPDTALIASLGCGNPTAMADLHPGESVLDLGSGGGIDVLLSARRVGPTGRCLRARHDRRDARPRKGQPGQGRDRERPAGSRATSKRIPLAAASVDVVLSNCVINLSTDKPQVLREAARVLKPGGRFAVSDVVADTDMETHATRDDLAQYVGCIAGALTRDDYTRYLAEAGLTDIEIVETHRVHEHAASAIVRARKPA